MDRRKLPRPQRLQDPADAGKPYDAPASQPLWPGALRARLSHGLQRRAAERDLLLTGHKTLNYGDCILEHRAAAAAGMDERIFLNMRGKLAEGTVSNLFLVSGGRIYTPALSCGLLPGVLRSYLLERYRVEEGEIDPRELENFDECFVTNSLMGVMPVQQLGERVFPSRETVDRLRSAYEAEKGTLNKKPRIRTVHVHEYTM